MILICLGIIYAMPPRPGLKLSVADAKMRAHLGIDIAKNPVRDIGKRGIFNTPGDVQPLVSGTKLFPVVCINYRDTSNTYSVANFQAMLFSDTWFSGSANAYYNEVSYGTFNLQGTVYGWYTSDSNRAYYRDTIGIGPIGDQRAAILAREAAQKADAAINYALYDNDGDGYVDCFTCVHAWYGREETLSVTAFGSRFWSFSDAEIGAYTTNDGVIIDNFVLVPERHYRSYNSNYGTMSTIGVPVHEWGHALGLPDLYDTDGEGEGLGNWCMMATGAWGGNSYSPWRPVHLCSWAKMELGWINPTAVRRRNLYSIPQVETNSRAYWLIARQRTFKEYFLVENRRQTLLFDDSLPGQGLLIYHIDDSVIASRRDSNQVNAGSPLGSIGEWSYGVALEQADGYDHLYGRYFGTNRGDANDPWPGGLSRTLFDSISSPSIPPPANSLTNYPLFANLVTSCFVNNIPVSSSLMSCTLSSGVVGAFTGGPDVSGYRWIDSDTTGGPTYSWIDISGTGTAFGSGDDARYLFKLPFDFNFYGTTYDTVRVCTNGWLSFGADPGTNAPTNTSVPSSGAPNRAVFVFWDDLNLVPSDGGFIYYQIFGSAPNRYCVITWKDARINGAPLPGWFRPANLVTFQAILYEQDSSIVLQYQDCAVGDTNYNWGRSATVGIENSAGTVGLQYLYNGSPTGNLLASERAIRFFTTWNPTPTLTGILPTSGNRLQALQVVFTGTNYISGVSSVSFGPDILTLTTVNSSTQITANIIIGASAATGARDVSVTNAGPGGGTATLAGGFTVFTEIPGWQSLANFITISDGGAFVAVTGEKSGDLLYALRGSKSNEFYMYYEGWTPKESLQFGYKYPLTEPPKLNKKFPGKGAALCFDGDHTIYATKGNGTWEFWAYDVTLDTWAPKAFVPTTQKLKGGTSMAYKNGLVYLLAGAQKKDNFNNFFAYDPTLNTWTTLCGAPVTPPATLKAKPFKDGSAISIIGNTIYALKGGDKYNFFYTYDIAGDYWVEKETIPLIHPMLLKKNKVGNGGAMTTDGSILYAIKGKGKQDFWSYSPISKGVWIPLDTIPRFGEAYKKSVPKTGAALAYANDAVWLMKGNKTPEFWCYTPSVPLVAKTISSTTPTVMAEKTTLVKFSIDVSPNPFTKLTTIRYTVPISGKVTLKLYNATGRLVETLVNDNLNAGIYTANLSSKNIAKGVYFLRYSDNTNQKEIKLIVE